MTRQEFLALANHARIKYVGAKSLEELFAPTHFEEEPSWEKRPTRKCKAKGGTLDCASYCAIPKPPKTFLTKGVIVAYAYEDNWGSTRRGSKKGDISLNYYGGAICPIDPKEWILVDARKWVEGETEYKRAKSYIPQVARKFKEEVKNFLVRYRRSMEYKLDSLPLDKKLKAIMELSPEDKKWFGIMSANPDDVILLIEKAFENEEL